MLSKRERWILALLVVSAFINYIDRTTLSVGAASIQKELQLSNYRVGLLLSAFFWTYAAFQLFAVAGWLVDRFHVGWVYAGGFLLWSAATAGTGISRGFASLFALRLLLGIGESVAYPAYARILATFPERRRGLANAAIDAGTRTGPAVGTLLGGLLMAGFGWRVFFLALGLGSMLWLAVWLFFMPDGRAAAVQKDDGNAPGVVDILGQRSAWFSFFGLFCGNYFWYFLVTWLPAYMQKERHFPAPRWRFWERWHFSRRRRRASSADGSPTAGLRPAPPPRACARPSPARASRWPPSSCRCRWCAATERRWCCSCWPARSSGCGAPTCGPSPKRWPAPAPPENGAPCRTAWGTSPESPRHGSPAGWCSVPASSISRSWWPRWWRWPVPPSPFSASDRWSR